MDLLNVPLGKWGGVPAEIHWSLTVVMLALAVTSPPTAAVYAGLFLIVLLHEYGHVAAGKLYGCGASGVTIYPFGGIADMRIPTSFSGETVVSLAGPAVNVLLAPLLWWLSRYHLILAHVAIANVAVLFFNLLPAFPMDGGRVLRALLYRATGNRLTATRTAAAASAVICAGLVVAAILLGNPLSVVAMIMVTLVVGAGAAEELVRLGGDDLTHSGNEESW